jgi:cytochrome c oxidase subunit II
VSVIRSTVAESASLVTRDWAGLALGVTSICILGGCHAEPEVRVDAVEVRLVAEDRSWRASYLLPQHGGPALAVPTEREVHVPLGADVRLGLTSRDYIADFRLSGLGLRDFAAPELPSEFRFRADHVGRYDLRGDELCGLPHTDKTRGWLIVEDPASFRAWVQKRMQGDRPQGNRQ